MIDLALLKTGAALSFACVAVIVDSNPAAEPVLKPQSRGDRLGHHGMGCGHHQECISLDPVLIEQIECFVEQYRLDALSNELAL
jgi:hypothetical protein